MPSPFCQYPEVAVEASQGRERMQEGRQNSLQRVCPAPPEELVQFWAHHHPGFRKTSGINPSA